MIPILRSDGTWFNPTGENTAFVVQFGWYAAAIDGSLPDCALRTFILLLSAGF